MLQEQKSYAGRSQRPSSVVETPWGYALFQYKDSDAALMQQIADATNEEGEEDVAVEKGFAAAFLQREAAKHDRCHPDPPWRHFTLLLTPFCPASPAILAGSPWSTPERRGSPQLPDGATWRSR